MKTGRRIANPSSKQLAGTYRKDRHENIVQLVEPTLGGPVQPGYLSEEAKKVWAEEINRVIACGSTDADSSIFARYCEMEAAFRLMIKEGNLPKSALMTELRRSAELLGIGGLRSRLARAGGEKPAPTSAFTVRPN